MILMSWRHIGDFSLVLLVGILNLSGETTHTHAAPSAVARLADSAILCEQWQRAILPVGVFLIYSIWHVWKETVIQIYMCVRCCRMRTRSFCPVVKGYFLRKRHFFMQPLVLPAKKPRLFWLVQVKIDPILSWAAATQLGAFSFVILAL